MLTIWARLRQEPLAVLAAVCWLIATICLYHRLPYGVSHGDEAFYSAVPYSMLLGNRPYIDELSITQNAGIFLVPFFWLYLLINKTADGIVLFNRYLYFGYALLCSALAFRFVRLVVGTAAACCVAALVVTFSYANLLALSYNTFGAFGFFCGVMCSVTGLLRPRPGPLLFAGFLFLLSAVFSYPGLVLVAPLYVLTLVAWLYWKMPRASLRSGLVGLGAGMAVGVALLLPLAVWLGRSRLHGLFAYTHSLGYASTSSFAKFNFFRLGLPPPWGSVIPSLAAVFVALPLSCWLLPRWVWLLAPAFGILFFYGYTGGIPIANNVMAPCLMALPTLAPVCVALNGEWRYGRTLLALIWAPSYLSMLATVFTSSNGYWSMSLGSLGATVAGVTSLAALLQHLAHRKPHNRLGYALVFATFYCALQMAEISSLFGSVYDENSILGTHDTRVKVGPFRGAMATAREAEFLTTIDRDLKSLQGAGQTLTVFDNFPTGYMSTRLQPRTFSTWIFWGMEPHYRAELMHATFGTSQQLPDFVLKIHMGGATQGIWSRYERNLYRPILERPEYHYVVLQRTAAQPEPRHRRHRTH